MVPQWNILQDELTWLLNKFWAYLMNLMFISRRDILWHDDGRWKKALYETSPVILQLTSVIVLDGNTKILSLLSKKRRYKYLHQGCCDVWLAPTYCWIFSYCNWLSSKFFPAKSIQNGLANGRRYRLFMFFTRPMCYCSRCSWHSHYWWKSLELHIALIERQYTESDRYNSSNSDGTRHFGEFCRNRSRYQSWDAFILSWRSRGHRGHSHFNLELWCAKSCEKNASFSSKIFNVYLTFY